MDKQRQHQKEFLTLAFQRLDGSTGLISHDRMSLQTAHADLVKDMGLNDSHFDAFLENLVDAFEELEIDSQLTKEVYAMIESMRDQVLNRDVSPEAGVEQQIGELVAYLHCLLDMSAYNPQGRVHTSSERLDALLSNILKQATCIQEAYRKEKEY